MDVILVGLPGSGKSAVGRRIAARHGATFVDLDERIEQAAGRTVREIFASDGEPEFRRLEREAVESLGPPDAAPELRRVISPGGGAVVDPRNRWLLFRGRLPVWLDVRPEVLGQRLRNSPNVRPLVQGADPVGRIRQLAASRERFYGAAARVNGVVAMGTVIDAVDRLVAGGVPTGTTLLRVATPIGSIVLGEAIAAAAIGDALRQLRARRAVIVSEPGAFAAFGTGVAAALEGAGWPVDAVMLPAGEAAKTLEVVGDAARRLARLRVERRDPLIAIGGGALGDPAGFLAATYLRGVPWIQVPTTLVAQVDSSIGGKTGVDLPEGKNLMGAFHQPAAIVLDIEALRTLPARQHRAALGEIVKMAALGDEALFATLEADGPAVAQGGDAAFDRGVMAEIVERPAWAKVTVVLADEREQGASGGRITLNLGHTVAHGLETADGYATLLHGEAVAYGLRAATRIGRALGVTPAARADRIERLLDALGLGQAPLTHSPVAVLAASDADKKHAGGKLRWVLPTADGVLVRDDVPREMVADAVTAVLAGTPASAPSPSSGSAGSASPGSAGSASPGSAGSASPESAPARRSPSAAARTSRRGTS
jgi:3-dehydroquinate synthetase/shikimate kinase